MRIKRPATTIKEMADSAMQTKKQIVVPVRKPRSSSSPVTQISNKVKDLQKTPGGKILSNLADKKMEFNFNVGKGKYGLTIGKIDQHSFGNTLSPELKERLKSRGMKDIDKKFDHMGIKITKNF